MTKFSVLLLMCEVLLWLIMIALSSVNYYWGRSSLLTPEHRCLLPTEKSAEFDLPENIRDKSFPFDTKRNKFSDCEYKEDNWFDPQDSDETVPCGDYVWKSSSVDSYVTRIFDLVCDRQALRFLPNLMMMFGALIAGIGFVLTSNVLRPLTFFVGLAMIQLIGGVAISIFSEFSCYVLASMAVGFSSSFIFLLALSLSLEMLQKNTEYKNIAVIFCVTSVSIGKVITGITAASIDDWQWLQAALTGPCVVFLLWWFIQCPISWLATHCKKKTAEATNESQKEKIDNILSVTESKVITSVKTKILSLINLETERIKALVIFPVCFFIAVTYYGLIWNVGISLEYQNLNHILSGVFEVIAFILLLIYWNRVGSKNILMCSSLITFVTLLLLTFVPQNWPMWVTWTTFLISKISATICYATFYVFTLELLSTVDKNVLLGAVSITASFGGILAALIARQALTWDFLPIFIFMIAALLGLLLIIYNKIE